MAVDFYTKWLDVPSGPRPPDYYTLLGVEVFCDDLDAIEAATRQRLTRLDDFALHPDRQTRQVVQDMMNQVARARVDLVNPDRRPDYDRRLAEQLGVPVPGQPETPAEEPEEVVSQPVVEEVVTAAEQFEAVVWRHLRKWKLNAQEQRLLMAEAAALGVPDDEAVGIIQRKDHEAEILAEKKHRRQIGVVIGLAAGVVAALIVGVILFVSSADRDRSLKEKNFLAVIEAAQKRLDQGDPDGAERKLAKAATIIPDDPRLEELTIDITLQRKAIADAFTGSLSRARGLMDRGELDRAASELSKAEAAWPGDARLKSLRRKLAEKRAHVKQEREKREREKQARAKREQMLRRAVSAISASLEAGDAKVAAKALSEAELAHPNEPRLAELRQRLAGRQTHQTKEQKFQQAVSTVLASLAKEDLKAAAKGLSEAEAILPRDPRLVPLRRRLTVTTRPAADGRRITNLDGHAGRVIAVAFLPDGRHIASASHDTSVKIWDAASGRVIRTLNVHRRGPFSFAFSSDGKRVATGGRGGIVDILDVASGRKVTTLDGHADCALSVVFSPDSKRIAFTSSDSTVTISDVDEPLKAAPKAPPEAKAAQA